MEIGKVLYYYTNLRDSAKIDLEGFIGPTFNELSLDNLGAFDHKYPNIFLTDIPPGVINSIDIGYDFGQIEVGYPMRVLDILNQGLKVFKCPREEYENIYSIPLKEGQRLRIDRTKKILIR